MAELNEAESTEDAKKRKCKKKPLKRQLRKQRRIMKPISPMQKMMTVILSQAR